MPIEPIVKVLFIFAVMVMGLAPIITWIERKQSAVMASPCWACFIRLQM